MKATYEIRDVTLVSPTHVQLYARFSLEGNVIDGDTAALGWELIDINPFSDEENLRLQLEDILRRKVAAQRAAAVALAIDTAPVTMEVDD